jgi:hypothetical protein
MGNYNSDSQGLHLNLQHCRVTFASDLTTAEVRDIIKLFARQYIPAKDVLKQAKECKLKVPYVHGTLVFTILETHKVGDRYHLRGRQ